MRENQLTRPAVTVATIVVHDGAFLMVEEETRDGVRLNQPAGHLEAGETLVDAAVRETLEETGYRVAPTALVGIYRWQAMATGATFIRFAFAGEDKEYTPGHKRLIAQVKGWKINLQVCYDLRFPVWARQQSTDQPEYDVLLYVANWPERRATAWKSLLTARAIENQCYVIGVNRVGLDGNGINHSGDSMVVDALGNTVWHQVNDEIVHTITLEKESLQQIREKFPFWKDADDFKIL
jgi:predicted amidohydrolase